MLRRPQRYAEFVDRELGATARAPILVVTPFGFGVSGRQLQDGRLRRIDRARARSLVRGLEVAKPRGGDALARAAMAAVRRIARAGDRPLPADVPAARLVGSSERGGDADGGSNDLARFAALFGGTFLVLWLSFELWTRRGREA
jgi:hypothetical protein